MFNFFSCLTEKLPTLKAVNEFTLEVLGAGGAFWAIFYAIPETLLTQVCDARNKNCLSDEAELIWSGTVATLALILMANASHQKYVVSKDTNNYQRLE